MTGDGSSARSRWQIDSIEGNASHEDETVVRAALAELFVTEDAAMSSSLWLRAGRAQGRRLGMSDYRDRFSKDDSWRLSARFPFGGREYPGLAGRGDAR